MAMFKKILITILSVFMLNQAFAQPSQYTPMTANGYQMKRVKVDSTLHIPSFCGLPTLRGSTSSMGALAIDTCNNKLYKYSTEFEWTEVGSSDFIDTIFRRNDSVFAKKNGITLFQFKDSTGGGGTTPTLQQVLTAGSTVTSNNVITGTTTTRIVQTGSGVKTASLSVDTSQIALTNLSTNSNNSFLWLNPTTAQLSAKSVLLDQTNFVANGTSSLLSFTRIPSTNRSIGVDVNGSFVSSNAGSFYFPLTLGTTGQILKLTSASQLAWANDSSGGSSVDTTSLSNRIDSKIDSLKRSTDSIFAYKNGQWNFQYKDSIGSGTSGAANDTAKVVIAKVHNATGTTLQRGEVVYLSGANGDVASVKRANNKQDSTSSKTFGIVRRDIAAGDTGYITTQGQIEKLNLGAYSPGDILWLDSIDGQFTKSVPIAPYHSVFLGVVERANNGNGLMYVKPQNGYELGELHNVRLNGVVNNQVLAYSDTQKVWKNRNAYTVIDTTKLQQKSLPAYSIMGNKTNAAANPTAVYFKDTSGTYTGTPAWNGTAPTTLTATYRWTRIGKRVDINIVLVYTTAGSANSTLTLPLPSDAPTPAEPSGATANSNFLYPAYGMMNTTLTTLTNAAFRGGIRKNSGGTGYEFHVNFTGTPIIVYVNSTYWTN